MATKKTKSKTQEPTGLAIYRCRFCNQLFLLSPPQQPDAGPPLNEWHNGSCLREASGYADLVAVVFPGHPGYPATEETRKEAEK